MRIALISTNERSIEHGLRSISTYLQENGFETKMIFMPMFSRYGNENYSDKTLNDLQDLIKDCQLIAFSCMSAYYNRTVQVIRFLRPKINSYFVWGGIHATLFPESCVNEVDAVGIGEGEEALLELITKIKKKESYLDTRNFWFNYNGKIVKNPVRQLFENIDLLPYPDYNLKSQYILNNNNFVNADEFFKDNFWQFYSGRISVFSTRGCPYACTYCSNNVLNELYKAKGTIIRKKSVDRVIGEIKVLLKIFPEAKMVFIEDDLFTVRTKEELINFSKKYKKEINIPFECYFTPHFTDEETFRLLIDTGLKRVFMGVQTGSERINREIYKRRFNNNMVLNSSKVINKYQDKLSPTNYQFIISNPYETDEDIIATINLIKNIVPPFNAHMNNLVYFPGTEMRAMVEKDKIYKDLDKKSSTNIFDDLGHMKFEDKNLYLNSILRCMGGHVSKNRIGLLPRFMVDPLISLNKNKFKFIGLSFVLSIVYLKALRNRMYYRLMPLLPISIQNYFSNKVLKE